MNFRHYFFLTLMFVAVLRPFPAYSQPDLVIKDKERCQVCGMFVAKYPNWIAQIILVDRTTYYFDGVKDLMVFSLNSSRYGVDQQFISEVWVKDYYSLDWIDGKKCFYVVGSDVHGPMGHEFIPFSTRDAAINFLKDHQGKEIVVFADITGQRVESMRVGQKMR